MSVADVGIPNSARRNSQHESRAEQKVPMFLFEFVAGVS